MVCSIFVGVVFVDLLFWCSTIAFFTQPTYQNARDDGDGSVTVVTVEVKVDANNNRKSFSVEFSLYEHQIQFIIKSHTHYQTFRGHSKNENLTFMIIVLNQYEYQNWKNIIANGQRHIATRIRNI